MPDCWWLVTVSRAGRTKIIRRRWVQPMTESQGSKAEYGLRLACGGDAGDVLPIDDERAMRMLDRLGPATVNGKPATLVVRTVTTGTWRDVDRWQDRESGHDLGDDPDGDADPWA